MWEWLGAPAAVAIGLLLRFGIPLGLTLILIKWLRQIDVRWQAESECARRTQPQALVQASPACWQVRNCSLEQRLTCPAYQHPTLPCWQIRRAATGRLPERCLDCAVFRNAPVSKPA